MGCICFLALLKKYKPSSLKQQDILALWNSEVQDGTKAVLLLGALGESPCLCRSQPLQVAHIPWLVSYITSTSASTGTSSDLDLLPVS